MKFLITTSIFIFLLGVTIAAEYKVPTAAASVTAADLDLDGDMDLVIGHNYDFNTEWSGISILIQDSVGDFSLADSLYLYGGQTNIFTCNLDSNLKPEIIAKYYDKENDNEYIAIIYNSDLTDTNFISLNTNEGVGYYSSGDIDGDGDTDIVFASNDGLFWGWIYNDGNGNFSEPNYHYYEENYPSDIACGDINGDGRADVGVSAQTTRVYFSYPDSFKAVILEENGFKDNIVLTDMDKDGDKDVVVSENLIFSFTTNTTYEYSGEDSFILHEKKKFSPSTSTLVVSDVNNDSLPDMVYTALDGIYVLYNEGNFILSDPEFFPIPNYGEIWRKSFCADLDGNGYNDVVTVRTLYEEIASNVNILYNDGTGRFQDTSPVGIKNKKNPAVPKEYNLWNFPNPFNNSTFIRFTLSQPETVSLEIYNVRGQQISRLLVDHPLKAGQHTFAWYGRNNSETVVSSGIYVAVLKTEKVTQNHKLLFVK